MGKQNQVQHKQVTEQAQAKSAKPETKPLETAVFLPCSATAFTDPDNIMTA